MAAAKKYWIGLKWRSDIKRPGSLRAMDFMRANGNKVRVQLFNVLERSFSKPLHGVGMKHDPLFPAQRPEFLHGLNGAGLIIGRHDGNKNRVGTQRDSKGVGSHEAFLIHRKIGYLEPFITCQVLTGMENGVVL